MHERVAAIVPSWPGNSRQRQSKQWPSKAGFREKRSAAAPFRGRGAERRGDGAERSPPPLSSVEVGDRCCGKTPIGAVIRGSFVLPCTCAVTLCTCAVTLCTCAVTPQESCGLRQRSIVGYGICVRASTGDAGFLRKAQRPRLPLSRSGVDVKDSPIRASTRGSFVLPCNLCRHSMYLCRHSVVVGDRRGPRRHLLLPTSPEWSGRPIFAGLAASLRCQVGSRALPPRRRSACHKT